MDLNPSQVSATANQDYITQANQLTCPILSLPPELRNAIYTSVFQDTVLEIYPSRSSLRFYDTYRWRHDLRSFLKYLGPTTGLLQTCRQIRIETHHLFFATATFDIRGLDPLDFIQQLGPEKVAMIASIIADENTAYNPRDGGSEVWLSRTQGKLLGLENALLIGCSAPQNHKTRHLIGS